MKHLAFIALGGSAGATFRYLLAKNIQGSIGQIFPVGTLFVNVSGSLMIGFLVTFFDTIAVSSDIRSMLTIGFLGAFTTFSTFSLETINLFRSGEIKLGLLNVFLSNFICLLMVFAGMLISKAFLKIMRI